MIEYRRFHNADPPQIVKLWHAAQLGRGAATGLTSDAFEHLNFSQGYFDKDGLILAVDTETQQIVGMGHAGFGPNRQGDQLSPDIGVICILVVHPDYRRRGVGREHVRRLEGFLTDSGAKTILAGPAEPFDPFFVGLYGGSQPSGFLDSDPDARPFFEALGYEAVESFVIFQRDLRSGREPMNFRMVNIRRKTELVLAENEPLPTWWWATRFGRLDTLRFQLITKDDKTPLAAVTILGLDLFYPRWRERVIGLIDLTVPEEHRRQGYGQALLLEIAKRLREELVDRLEAHISLSNEPAQEVFKSAGFNQVDQGTVYRKKQAE